VRAIATGIEDDGTPWLAMELIEGQPLHVYMRSRGTLSVPEAVGITRQIVAGLAAAHRVGVIHRDIKPSNIMVSEDDGLPHVRIVDLGLARFMESSSYRKLTMTGQIVGTPGYLSPEQARGQPLDVRSDLFAVGAILHALLMGRPPFGQGPEALVRLTRDDRVPLSRSHPQLGPITRIVDQCLAHAPSERFPTARALDEALAPLDASESSVSPWVPPDTIDTLVLPPDPVLDIPDTRSSIRAPDAPERASEAPRRAHGRWLLAGLALLVLVVVVATSGYVLYTASSEPAPARATAPHTVGVPVEASPPKPSKPRPEASEPTPFGAGLLDDVEPHPPNVGSASYRATFVITEGTVDADTLEGLLEPCPTSTTSGERYRARVSWSATGGATSYIYSALTPHPPPELSNCLRQDTFDDLEGEIVVDVLFEAAPAPSLVVLDGRVDGVPDPESNVEM
jgi:hypothetical protein